jgi:hypothetical protein
VGAGQGDAGGRVRRDLLERRRLPTKIDEVGIRKADAPEVDVPPEDANEPILRLVREWPKQHSVHDGEDRAVRADPDGEREHHRERKARPPSERAGGVPEVLDEGVHEVRGARCAVRGKTNSSPRAEGLLRDLVLLETDCRM